MIDRYFDWSNHDVSWILYPQDILEIICQCIIAMGWFIALVPDIDQFQSNKSDKCVMKGLITRRDIFEI